MTDMNKYIGPFVHYDVNFKCIYIRIFCTFVFRSSCSETQSEYADKPILKQNELHSGKRVFS